MATGCVDRIFNKQCAIRMTSLKLTSTNLDTLQFVSENILRLSINLDQNYAEPDIGKIFKTNIILFTKYLNLNWNIIKNSFY